LTLSLTKQEGWTRRQARVDEQHGAEWERGGRGRTELQLGFLLLERDVALARLGLERAVVALGLERLERDLDGALLQVGRLRRRVGVAERRLDALVDELAQLGVEPRALVGGRRLVELALERRPRSICERETSARSGLRLNLERRERTRGRTELRLDLEPLRPRLVHLVALGAQLCLQELHNVVNARER